MLTSRSKRIENSIKEITEKSETKKMEVSRADPDPSPACHDKVRC